MSKLDPRIEAVRQQYGLEASDFWQIPQNKQWVCKHAALEIVATKANVEWSAPQIIEANTGSGIAVLVVTGKMGERVEWATGEASPKNNKNSYPWAMAEKRAKDRVILKLVGIHGLVYSEDEMPPEPVVQQVVYQATAANAPGKSSAQLKREGSWENVTSALYAELNDVHTLVALERVKDAYRERVKQEGWNKTYASQLAQIFEDKAEEIRRQLEKEAA